MLKILFSAASLYALAIGPGHAVPTTIASDTARFDTYTVADGPCWSINASTGSFSACLAFIGTGPNEGIGWAEFDPGTGGYVRVWIPFGLGTFILSLLEANTDPAEPLNNGATLSESFILDARSIDSASFTVTGGPFGFVGYATYEALVPRVWVADEVPEPATLALLGAGLIGLSVALRRRKT